MHRPYVWETPFQSAYCFTIDVDAESPQIWRSRTTGIRGLNQLEQRRYGLREGLWHLLGLLKQYEVAATCFVPVYEASSRPWLLEELTRQGHEIGLHGKVHETVHDLEPGVFAEIVQEGLDFVEEVTGKRPQGFRSPSWEMTPQSLEILRNSGLTYDSSLSGYDHPYEWDGGLVELPIQWPLDDAVFFRYVGGGGDTSPPTATGQVCTAWLDACMALHGCGGLAVSTVHPWLTGRSYRMALAEALLIHASQTQGLWTATLGQVADWHKTSCNRGAYVEDAAIPDVGDLIAHV